MSDPAPIREELHRKALETLAYYTDRCEKGLVSEAEFSAGVDATWSCASGLVGKEFLQLVTEANHVARGADRSQCRIFNRPGDLVVLRWTPGCANIEEIGSDRLKTNVFKVAPENVKALVEELSTRLTDLGFLHI